MPVDRLDETFHRLNNNHRDHEDDGGSNHYLYGLKGKKITVHTTYNHGVGGGETWGRRGVNGGRKQFLARGLAWRPKLSFPRLESCFFTLESVVRMLRCNRSITCYYISVRRNTQHLDKSNQAGRQPNQNISTDRVPLLRSSQPST